VDSDDLDSGATVGSAISTSDACAAPHVWFDGSSVPDLEGFAAGANRQDFDPQFVTQYPWILEEGLVASESMVIGAADADTVNPDYGFPGTDG